MPTWLVTATWSGDAAAREVPLPAGFRAVDVAAVGDRLFVSGFAADEDAPVVLHAIVDGDTVRWTDPLPIDGAEVAFPLVDAELRADGVRLAVSRRGEDVNEPPIVVDRVGERWAAPATLLLPWSRESGEVDRQFEYGHPLVLRGDEIVLASQPGAEIRPGERPSDASPALVHYRLRGDRWDGEVVPFAAGVTTPWWELALSDDALALAATSEHAEGRWHLDLYERPAGGAFRSVRSLPLGETPPTAVVFVAGAFVVAAGELAVIDRSTGEWAERRRVALPPTASPGVGTAQRLVSLGDAVHVDRSDGARFLVRPDGTVRALAGPRPPNAPRADVVEVIAVSPQWLYGVTRAGGVVSFPRP